MPTAPDLTAVKAYLGADSSWTDAEVTAALDAETVAQANAVIFPADPEPPASPLPYPADLAEALKRRVLRHLSMKALPLGFQPSVTEQLGTVALRVGSDLEVRRLEAPYKRRTVA